MLYKQKNILTTSKNLKITLYMQVIPTPEDMLSLYVHLGDISKVTQSLLSLIAIHVTIDNRHPGYQ